MGKKRTADIEELRNFLSQVKEIASCPDCFILVPREKNREALTEFGLDAAFVREFVQVLSVGNYSYTDVDIDFPGDEVWVFGGNVMNVSFYIKIKLENVEGVSIVKCLSFHPEERPLTFPYKSQVTSQ